MIELAKHQPHPKPVQLRRVAEAHGISPQFLVQIASQLKAAQLVSSTRGACGGYRLSRAANEISIGDVVRAIEGPDDGQEIEPRCNPTSMTLQQMFHSVRADLWRRFDAKSLQDLVDEVPALNEPMYYI